VKVYVAASSKQIDRARAAMDRLRAAGHTVTHDWTASIAEVGCANPIDATRQQRRNWALDDLQGVLEADVLWVLMPADHDSFGAGVEFGRAIDSDVSRIVCSGACASIFTSLADAEYGRDDQAFEAEFFKLAVH
jgi:hypothetical protein